jgi:hypothetical protein
MTNAQATKHLHKDRYAEKRKDIAVQNIQSKNEAERRAAAK